MSIVIDLPFPPSVNSIWRGSGKHVYRSEKYKDWIADAWGCWLCQRATQKEKSIKGYYTLTVILNAPDKRLRDVGNYEKATSDFLEKIRVIQNDCLCCDQHLVWGDQDDAPLGMRVILDQFDGEPTQAYKRSAPARR